jgi:hypothetical protein
MYYACLSFFVSYIRETSIYLFSNLQFLTYKELGFFWFLTSFTEFEVWNFYLSFSWQNYQNQNEVFKKSAKRIIYRQQNKWQNMYHRYFLAFQKQKISTFTRTESYIISECIFVYIFFYIQFLKETVSASGQSLLKYK